MKKQIELSYDADIFSKEFENKIFMYKTLKECNKIIDEIITQIEKSNLSKSNEYEILIDYFKKKEINNDFEVFIPRNFYTIWIDKMKSYAQEYISDNEDVSDYFWNNFPTNHELYDNDFIKEIDEMLFNSELKGNMVIFNKDYAYTHFKKLCEKACGYNSLDIDNGKQKKLLNKSNAIFDLIKKLFAYIWDRYLKFIDYNGEEPIPDLLYHSLEEKNIATENIEKKKIDNKRHTNIMNIINIVIPGILLAPLGTGLFTSHDGTFTFILLLLGDIFWLVIGISLNRNTCKKCGKYNSYDVINEEVLDSYITTKTRYRTNSSGKSVPYEVTVTMQKIKQTLCCQNCGDLQYKNVEREK